MILSPSAVRRKWQEETPYIPDLDPQDAHNHAFSDFVSAERIAMARAILAQVTPSTFCCFWCPWSVDWKGTCHERNKSSNLYDEHSGQSSSPTVAGLEVPRELPPETVKIQGRTMNSQLSAAKSIIA